MDPIVRRKLSNEVLDRLIAAISAGEYGPNGHLPSERELMVQCGVGRPAIREAMQSLQQMGMIRISHGERSRIVTPTPHSVVEQISTAMIHLLASNPRGLEDLKEARILFEIGMARLAAERIIGSGLERLAARHGACREALGKGLRFIEEDMAFHREIAAVSGNQLITAVSQGMLAWLSRFRRDLVSMRGADELTLAEHEAIFQAIASRRPDEAAAAMSNHLRRANALYTALESNQERPPTTRTPDTRQPVG